jgi:hypothetical protein
VARGHRDRRRRGVHGPRELAGRPHARHPGRHHRHDLPVQDRRGRRDRRQPGGSAAADPAAAGQDAAGRVPHPGRAADPEQPGGHRPPGDRPDRGVRDRLGEVAPEAADPHLQRQAALARPGGQEAAPRTRPLGGAAGKRPAVRGARHRDHRPPRDGRVRAEDTVGRRHHQERRRVQRAGAAQVPEAPRPDEGGAAAEPGAGAADLRSGRARASRRRSDEERHPGRLIFPAAPPGEESPACRR